MHNTIDDADPDEEYPRQKNICATCVGDEYLSREIRGYGVLQTCSYCDHEDPCYDLKKMAKRIEAAFAHHYIRTTDQAQDWQYSMLSDRDFDYEWVRQGVLINEAIELAAQITSQAADDIHEILREDHFDFDTAVMGEESEFEGDSYYVLRRVDLNARYNEWHNFEQSLKTESRFFSTTALQLLNEIFGEIEKFKTLNGRSLIKKISSKVPLYRARVFQSSLSLHEALGRPDIHLGPPSAKLSNGGRMNAKGISVFYGSTVEKTAIAEVRPPVGSKVAVAKFYSMRPLRLLDLTVFESVHISGSVFDSLYKDRLERTEFLRILGKIMTRPVMPDDEAMDYLATQAIADYLANEGTIDLDGIIFRSVQNKRGRNIVLFHKASEVEKLNIPKNMSISVSDGLFTDDSEETNYTVYESENSLDGENSHESIESKFDFSVSPDAISLGRSVREPTLRVDATSINVHSINSVSYQYETFDVVRRRQHTPITQRDPRAEFDPLC